MNGKVLKVGGMPGTIDAQSPNVGSITKVLHILNPFACVHEHNGHEMPFAQRYIRGILYNIIGR